MKQFTSLFNINRAWLSGWALAMSMLTPTTLISAYMKSMMAMLTTTTQQIRMAMRMIMTCGVRPLDSKKTVFMYTMVA